MIRLIWDFFGPDSRRTAEHHGVHLREFLVREGFSSARTGLGSAGEGHGMSWCELAEADAERVASVLRPQRRLPAEGDTHDETIGRGSLFDTPKHV